MALVVVTINRFYFPQPRLTAACRLEAPAADLGPRGVGLRPAPLVRNA